MSIWSRFLFVMLLPAFGFSGPTNTASSQVRTIMKEIEAGNLREVKSGAYSGWVMTNERSNSYHRAILQAQTKPFITLGADAVPELINWLSHEEMQMRYIASFSLATISGVRPRFPAFASLQELRAKGLLDTSIRVWSDWYVSRVATGSYNEVENAFPRDGHQRTNGFVGVPLGSELRGASPEGNKYEAQRVRP